MRSPYEGAELSSGWRRRCDGVYLDKTQPPWSCWKRQCQPTILRI